MIDIKGLDQFMVYVMLELFISINECYFCKDSVVVSFRDSNSKFCVFSITPAYFNKLLN